MTRRILFLFFFMFFSIGLCLGQSKNKLSKDDQAKMTPDQRIVHESERKNKKHKNESVKKKAKRAKKMDKSSRKIKQPKQPKRKGPKS